MKLTPQYRKIRATNYGETKTFGKDLIYFFQQLKTLASKAETDTRRYIQDLKPKDD